MSIRPKRWLIVPACSPLAGMGLIFTLLWKEGSVYNRRCLWDVHFIKVNKGIQCFSMGFFTDRAFVVLGNSHVFDGWLSYAHRFSCV